MLGAPVKLLLVATSFAPIFLTVAFIYALQHDWVTSAWCCITALSLVLACSLAVRASQRKLQPFPFPISSVRSADREIVGFVIAYLLPLASSTPFKQNPVVLAFVLVIFFVVVMTTNSYHFNPLMGLLHFHFYEATSGNITYVLITKKNLRCTSAISRVAQLTEYMVIDVDQ